MAGATRAQKLELLMNPAGQISGMLHESRSARDILEDMVREAAAIISGDLARRVTASV